MVSSSTLAEFALKEQKDKTLIEKIASITNVNRCWGLLNKPREEIACYERNSVPCMTFGQMHEEVVFGFLRNVLHMNVNDCGFIQFAEGSGYEDYLMFGASPDGITPEWDTVFEIKTVPSMTLSYDMPDKLASTGCPTESSMLRIFRHKRGKSQTMCMPIFCDEAPKALNFSLARNYRFFLFDNNTMDKFDVDNFSKLFTDKFRACCDRLGGHKTILAYFRHALSSTSYNVYQVDYSEHSGEILCQENLIESNCRQDARWIVVANPLYPLTLQIVLQCAAVASVSFRPIEKVNALYCTGIFSPPETDSCNTRKVVYGPGKQFVHGLEPNFSILRYLLVVDASFCETYTRAVLQRARKTFFKGLRLYSAALDGVATEKDKNRLLHRSFFAPKNHGQK
jgi:hypothetical protein